MVVDAQRLDALLVRRDGENAFEGAFMAVAFDFEQDGDEFARFIAGLQHLQIADLFLGDHFAELLRHDFLRFAGDEQAGRVHDGADAVEFLIGRHSAFPHERRERQQRGRDGAEDENVQNGIDR